jgi:hypothetical protein
LPRLWHSRQARNKPGAPGIGDMIPSGRFGTIRISASFIATVIMITITIMMAIATDGATTKEMTMDEIITGETTEASMMNKAIAARNLIGVCLEFGIMPSMG